MYSLILYNKQLSHTSTFDSAKLYNLSWKKKLYVVATMVQLIRQAFNAMKEGNASVLSDRKYSSFAIHVHFWDFRKVQNHNVLQIRGGWTFKIDNRIEKFII